MAKIKRPTDRQFRDDKLSLLECYAPKIYPCQKCGWAVMDGYCCSTCGDTNPRAKAAMDKVAKGFE